MCRAQLISSKSTNRYERNSGGPIINSDSQVVGVALEGARKDSGNNGCLFISEIQEVLASDEYKI